jgi:hypothetical protein
MCLSEHQKFVAARTVSAWPIERLQAVAAASIVAIQVIPSIFDWRHQRAEAARAARLTIAQSATVIPKAEPEGLPIATYAAAHGLGLATAYQQVQRGVLIAVRVGGKMLVQTHPR